ncbi:hypothetical protein ACHHRT_11085 [Desulfurivibrio sp. D14AmB]
MKNYTGVSAPYEAPANPDLRLDTGNRLLTECVASIIGLLTQKNILANK